MLVELQIRNFLIIEALNLSFEKGMTIITGETGAGKSILLDALQFVAGGRGDTKLVRMNKAEAEVSVQFMLEASHPFSEEGICILRRSVTEEGRTKAYINGNLVNVSELKKAGELLLSWVGQYEHQALLRPEAQRDALDRFAQADEVLKQVRDAAQRLKERTEILQDLQDQAQKEQEIHRFKTEHFRLLEELALQENEWERLHQEQKKLSAGSEVLGRIANMLNLLRENETNVIAQVKRIEKEVSQLAIAFTELQNPASLSTNAAVNLEEAYHDLKSFYDSLDLDPERLQSVETRLSQIHELSRRVHIQVEELFAYQQQLQQELNALESLDEAIKAAQQAVEAERLLYLTEAEKLTLLRQKAALSLSQHVSHEIRTLGMKEGQFAVEVETDLNRFSEKGQDQIEFRVRMNPGQAWSSLKEGASGGELSRIALVIAVLNAKQDQAETLIFDEVDVGVSGAVAEKVGQLLKKLAGESQVLCITHLPQVALLGDQHVHVSKAFREGHTFGSAKILNLEERIEEVARMMSGENITEHARQLARVGLKS